MGALCLGSYLACLAIAIMSWVLLPGRVATHFGPSGEPDGWSSPATNALVLIVIATFMFTVFYFMHRLIARMPMALINLPNKDYWLAPERADASLAKLAIQFRLFGAAILLLLCVAHALAVQANLVKPPKLDNLLFLGALGLFFVFTIVWAVSFYRSFRR